MRKPLRGLRLAAIAGLLQLPLAAPALAAPNCGSEVISLKTLHIQVSLPKTTYRIGETAIFKLTVTRPAHEDPAGLGIPVDPPTSEPAPDVNIGVGLIVDDVYLYGLGITDQAGQASIRVKIKGYTPAGYAQARALAKKTVIETPCLTIDEFGYRPIPDAFRVVR